MAPCKGKDVDINGAKNGERALGPVAGKDAANTGGLSHSGCCVAYCSESNSTSTISCSCSNYRSHESRGAASYTSTTGRGRDGIDVVEEEGRGRGYYKREGQMQGGSGLLLQGGWRAWLRRQYSYFYTTCVEGGEEEEEEEGVAISRTVNIESRSSDRRRRRRSMEEARSVSVMMVPAIGRPAPPVDDHELKLRQYIHHPLDNNINGAPVSSKPGDGTSTFSQATFNCTSLLLGLGLLSSPYAIAQTGWLGAVICLVLAATNMYTAQLLVHCQRTTGCGTYQELAQVAVGRKTCLFIQVLFYIEVIGSLLGYCISIADNMGQIFPTSTFSLPGLSFRNILLLISCLCVLPTLWMRDLSGLAFTSLWSVSASILLVVVVLAAASVDHIGFHHSIPLANIHGAPIAAGLYAFAFSGTTVFPNVYKSMKDPSKFTQVLIWSFSITTIFVFGLGVAGAAMFGKATASQVTLSMPTHRITTKIVLWATVLTPLLKFALVLAPVSESMDENLQEKFKEYSPRVQLGITTLARSTVMALVVIVAMLLPYFNYVIALIGSSVTIAICLIFPCIFYVKICWHRVTRISLALIFFTIAFALIAAVCGTILSFQGLVESRKHHTS